MQTIFRATVAPFLVIICLNSACREVAAQAGDNPQDALQDRAAEYVTKIAEAGASNRLPAIAEEYLAELSANELEVVAASENTVAALTAKWERTRRRLDSDGQAVENQLRLQRFLGFVEGRLRIPLPEWWSQRVLSIESKDRLDLLRFADTNTVEIPKYTRPLETSGVLMLGPEIQSAIVTESNIELTLKDRQYRLSRESFEFYGDPDRMAIAATAVEEHRCIIAAHELSPMGLQPIFLTDSRESEVQWNCVLLLTPTISGSSGPEDLSQWIDIEIHDGKAYVFHTSQFGFGLACLSLDDGTIEYEFSSEF